MPTKGLNRFRLVDRQLNSGQVLGTVATLSERADQLSADNDDALVTEAEFDEIEAFANSALVAV